jgi:hypothetical protein
MKYSIPKRRYRSTRMHNVITRKAKIFKSYVIYPFFNSLFIIIINNIIIIIQP